MQNYRLNIKLKSPVITPFHSDTLWGHICWALRYSQGEKELLDFIDCYRSGDPPLIISNAFPKNYLPFPVLEPMNKTRKRNLINALWEPSDFVSGVSALKKLLGSRYISKELLTNLNGKLISNHSIVEALLTNPKLCPKITASLPSDCIAKYRNGKIACNYLSSKIPYYCPPEFKNLVAFVEGLTDITYHAKVDRLLGTAIDGGLFTTNDNFYSNNDFEAYCKIGPRFSEETLKNCLDFINVDGFGRKKSTGKGEIHCKLEKIDDGFVNADANAFMALSNYVPSQDDPRKGFYKLITKYGKLGGHFANSSIIPDSNPTPFKYPLIMLEPGSVFKIENKKTYYGRIVQDIHFANNINIVHYGIAYPMPLKIEGLNE
jgi:CRISPR-associated protein Csm4